MMKGLENTTSLIQIYKLREDLYLRPAENVDFRAAVVQLYSQILEFQARTICHLSQKSIVRAFKNIIKSDPWDDLLDGVNATNLRCLTYTNLINEKAEYERWAMHRAQMEKSYDVESKILRAIEDAQKHDRAAREAERHEKDRREIMANLSSRYADEKDQNPKRIPRTCEWCLQDENFKRWRDLERSGVLWVSAGPGCGKSVLASCLVDESLASNSVLASTTCYFFFKDGQDGRRTASNALAAIIHQIFEQPPATGLFDHAIPHHLANHKDLPTMFNKLWSILLKIASDANTGEVVCIIDALDECGENEAEKLLAQLLEFYTSKGYGLNPEVRLKFLITSRPYDSIEREFVRLQRELLAISVQTCFHIQFEADEKSDQIAKEIDLYIDDRVPHIFFNWKLPDQQMIADNLKSKQNRTYLWLYLTLDVLKKRRCAFGTRKKVKAFLERLPESVYSAYEEILKRSSDQDLAISAFKLSLVRRYH